MLVSDLLPFFCIFLVPGLLTSVLSTFPGAIFIVLGKVLFYTLTRCAMVPRSSQSLLVVHPQSSLMQIVGVESVPEKDTERFEPL